ncbi:MAG TPA: DUF72 domain-containing protein [Flavisolibacter sp.]|nr:DUF72 domain-containing protein [Flavisolibacter sp.]
MQQINWHIGCSGFHYKEWKEVFYPKGWPQAKWFQYYTRHFSTIEINNTFYRFPELKLFENWYIKAPDDFSFSVKVPRTITHYQQFKETENQLADFYDLTKAGLKEKLGCILFQLPPQIHYSAEKLDSIVRQMNIFFRNVIEFRHISWWRKDVIDILHQHNISFCGVSYPGLINDPLVNTAFPYYRFHGVPKLYYSSYDHAFLDQIVAQIKQRDVTDAYLYFNNTASAAAIENAKYVQKVCGL